MKNLVSLYDRYLRGVDWGKAAKTLGAFYAFVSCLFIHAGLSTQLATKTAMATTAVASLLYLIIPKDKEALADNLLADAQAHQAQAEQITDKVVAAVATRTGVTLAPVTPVTQVTPGTSAPASPGEASDGNPGE